MTIRICEKWELPTPVAKHNEWFADWALRRPGEVSKHLTMGYHALHSIRDLLVDSVHESFGGIGAQALMVDYFWPRARHTVRDYSTAAVNYLSTNLPPYIQVMGGSTYNPDNFIKADVQVADVGDLTVHKWDKEPYDKWLDHTFQTGAKAVVLTDIAGRLLHLHRATYSKVLSTPVNTYEQYLKAMAVKVFAWYGYVATKTFYHSWSSITVFRPWWPGYEGHDLQPCPTEPRGLEILK